jgi:hypothetical protein
VSVTTAAGTVLSISAATPATFTQAGYEASAVSSSFAPIGEITDMGEHGREYAEVTHMPIGSRGVRKFKGSFNEGTKTMQLGLDSDDAGQIVAKAAVLSDNDYSFRVVYPSGDVDYFAAKVMSFRKAVTGVDTIVSATIALSLTTSSTGIGVVEVLAP